MHVTLFLYSKANKVNFHFLHNFPMYVCRETMSERRRKKSGFSPVLSDVLLFMRRLEKLCALHSNDRRQNVNFRLNLDEMCSLLTWGQFHSLLSSSFYGNIKLISAPSLSRSTNWRRVFALRRCLSCFTAAISAAEMALWMVSACF